jgi:glycerol-3-phosphate dehydrogenase (NAD(P)+)
MNEITIYGAGAWGTALAIQAVRAGSNTTLWCRDPARAAALAATRINPRLPGCRLPASIRIVSAPRAAPLALLATPVAHLRAIAAMAEAPFLVACCKGLEPGTLALPLEILSAVRPEAALGVISGPNLAHEIGAGLPAATVIAATDPALRRAVMAALGGQGFRLYGSADPIGAQTGGAVKNVIAIAAGAIANLGENARAALIARGVAELARLVVALGGKAETAMGLSGAGDLLLTCTSNSSRNYSLGLALGAGQTAREILAARDVATEGAATAALLLARAPGIDLPICAAVAGLLAGEKTLAETIASVMTRPLRDAEG